MNALPAISSPELISPLASKLVQFLAQEHAMGYRYREEGRALRELEGLNHEALHFRVLRWLTQTESAMHAL